MKLIEIDIEYFRKLTEYYNKALEEFFKLFNEYSKNEDMKFAFIIAAIWFYNALKKIILKEKFLEKDTLEYMEYDIAKDFKNLENE
jgi:hypothetical protein